MKKFKRFLLLLLLFAGIGEVFLRYYLGFCDAVLMREDPGYEYIAKASQNRFRFRNKVMYNSYSMRSNEPDTSAVRILVFGDSVINGGMLTDQDSLATTMLSDYFSKEKNKHIQFLNISAGSWGPDNGYAYLLKHGGFGASAVILAVSSHDAHDNMTFEKIVGISESFPQKQYLFAWSEIFCRYLVPRIGLYVTGTAGNELTSTGINKNDPRFNSGFASFQNYCAEHKIPLVIYLHAEQQEAKQGNYNSQGQEILRFANEQNIPVIRELDQPLTPEDYRDNIHPTESGQRKISALMEGRLGQWIAF